MIKKNITKLLIALIISINLLTIFPSLFSQNHINSNDNHKKNQATSNINKCFSITIAHAADTPYGRGADVGENVIVRALKKENSPEPWIFDLWNFFLSLVNILLIGILIFLGVVNILHINYDTYELKKFLVPLIIAIILANFSLFFCRAIAELSSAITMSLGEYDKIIDGLFKGLHLQGGDVANWAGLIDNKNEKFVVELASLGTYIVLTIVGIIFSIVLTVVILVLALLMFLLNYLIFLLAAVSPLAFIFMVLPATQGLFKQWWTWFLRLIFMGPIIILFLRVASIIGNSSGSYTYIGSIITFVLIIALMIAAIMVPFTIGGIMSFPGMKQAVDFAQKTGNAAVENTRFGRAIRGMVMAPIEKRKQELDSVEAGFKGGTTTAMETIDSGEKNPLEIFRASIKEGKDIASQSNLNRYKSDIADQASFDSAHASGKLDRLAKSKPGEYKALMGQAASNGLLNTTDKLNAVRNNLAKKMKKEEVAKEMDSIVKINNEARMGKNKPLVDYTNVDASNPITHSAEQNLDNKYPHISNTKLSSTERQKYAEQALKDIDILTTSGDATQKGKAKQKFLDVKFRIENDPQLTSLKNHPVFTRLNSNASLNSMAGHIGGMSSYLATSPGPGPRGTIEAHQLKNFQEVLSRPMNHNSEKDIRSLIHARNAFKSAGYNISNVNDFITDYNGHQSRSGGRVLGTEDADFIKNNFAQMNEIEKYSDDEQKRIIGEI